MIKEHDNVRGTFLYQGFPLIRMNTAVTQAFFFPNVRKRMARNWVEKYGLQGVGLCNNTLRLIAYVLPNAKIRMLRPPYQQFAMWQMANAPKVRSSVETECACAGYFDPEVQGPWRDRGLHPTVHHPHCQFSRSAAVVFQENYTAGMSRVAQNLSPQARADEWIASQRKHGGS